MSAARRRGWAEIIADELKQTTPRRITVWHHGSPRRDILDTPRPPFRSGRYHRSGGTPTWYGSSTQDAAWAEFARSQPGELSAEAQRRMGRVTFDVVAFDLTSADLQKRLGLDSSDLTGDELVVCETLADLAVAAGFQAVLGPSAAAASETTLAVFGPAIAKSAASVEDLGVRRPPVL